MISFPNAKINIGLYVTAKRADGYHDLETVFYPLHSVKDALEIVPAPTDNAFSDLILNGRSIAGNKEENLVWKAFLLLKEAFPEKISDVHIHLLKSIPMGAGMGGGSADAAFMLGMMNTYFDLGLSNAQLTDYALRLGSDCPFFVYNTPRLARGRGDLLEPIALDLGNYSFLIVCPHIHISTAVAFAGVRVAPASFPLADLPGLPLPEWKDKVYNVFEDSVFEAFPELRSVKPVLYGSGALYASMSGSGSAFYGIFSKNNLPSELSLPGMSFDLLHVP